MHLSITPVLTRLRQVIREILKPETIRDGTWH